MSRMEDHNKKQETSLMDLLGRLLCLKNSFTISENILDKINRTEDSPKCIKEKEIVNKNILDMFNEVDEEIGSLIGRIDCNLNKISNFIE